MTHTELHPAAEPEVASAGCTCAGGCGSRGRTVTRRSAIGAGVVAGAALVTACTSGDTATSSSATTSPTGTPGSTAGGSSSSAPSSEGPASSAATSADSPAEGTAAAPAGTEIAKLADIPAGGSLVVADGDNKIALARNADGTVVAHSAICTHQGCAVDADGASLRCPCHGSTFDAFTGAVTKPPADAPLATVSVAVSGEAVYLTA